VPEPPHVIEVHLRTAEQLYNSLDPSPFHERDLDDNAERYIVGWAREAKNSANMQLIVTLPDVARQAEAAQRIPDSIHNNFSYRALQSKHDLHELLRIGRRSLAIGIVILVLCFGAIRYLSLVTEQTTAIRLIEESFLILGWVANWRPLEIFLYDWWPIRRKTVLFEHLAAMPVEVRTASERVPSIP
jgi:hypothetical protein